jgi:hypothetical protein
MARKRISLAQFSVYNDGNYGSGSNLDHSYRRCDWEVCIDGWTPTEIARAARSHARECDGCPQPKAPPIRRGDSQFVPTLWAKAAQAALEQHLVRQSTSIRGR